MLAALATGLGGTYAQTSRSVAVQADSIIDSNFRGPFDLIVVADEGESDLLRANYLSSIDGRLPAGTLEAIRSVPGVDVAAPLSILGTTLISIVSDVDLSSALLEGGPGYYMLETSWISEGGLSTYPNTPIGIYFDPDLEVSRDTCPGLGSEFALTWACIGAPDEFFSSGGYPSSSGLWASFGIYLTQPIVVAAVDARSEAQLFGIDLAAIERASPTEPSELGSSTISVPAAFSNELEVDSAPEVSLSMVQLPPEVGDRFLGDESVFDFGRTEVFEGTLDPQIRYSELLASKGGEVTGIFLLDPGGVDYAGTGRALQPEVSPQSEVWSVAGVPVPPPGNSDVQFRVTSIRSTATFILRMDGSFAPPEQTSAVKLPVGAYHPPYLEDDAGRMIGPTMNVGGYLQQSPTALVTYEAADALGLELGIGSFATSSIRIRVEDEYANPAGLAFVADEVLRATNATVKSVSGTSVLEQEVLLPAGLFGRNQLVVREEFAQSGAALRAVEALSDKTALSYLLSAVLGIGGFFLVGAVLMTSRTEDRVALAVVGASKRTTAQTLMSGAAVPIVMGAAASLVTLRQTFESPQYVQSVGALSVGLLAFGLGIVMSSGNSTQRVRLRTSHVGCFWFALSDIANRQLSRLASLLTLGFAAALSGILLGLHYQLGDSRIGNQVPLLNPKSRTADLWLSLALVGATFLVVRMAALAARSKRPGQHPNSVVALSNQTLGTLVVWRLSIVALVVLFACLVSASFLSTSLSIGMTLGSIVAMLCICLTGVLVSEA